MSDYHCNEPIINYLNALINYKTSWIPQRKPDSQVHIPDSNCLYVIDKKINEISQYHKDFSNKNVENLNVDQLKHLKDYFMSQSNYKPNMSIKTTDELNIAKLEKNIKELENQRHNILKDGNFKEQREFNVNLQSLKEQLKEAQKGTIVYIGGKRRTKRRKSKKTTGKKGRKGRKSTKKSNKKLSKK